SLPELSLATYGTHDHEPLKTYYDNLVSWWHSEDGHEGWLEVQRLMEFLGLSEPYPQSFTDQLHDQFLKVLLQTPCWLAVLMITDLLGTAQRFNEPGLSGDYNWSQRLDKPLRELCSDPRSKERIDRFSQLIRRTDRAPGVYSQR